MHRVIALSGYKGSGKDTAASYLVSEYSYKQLSFAAKLKDLVANTYRVPREDLDNPHLKESPLFSYPTIPLDPFSQTVHLMLKDELSQGYWTPRALCILEGSVKRAVYSNYWVKEIIDEIVANPTVNYVISDLRYKSEADTLKMFLPSVELVRVVRFDSVSTNDPSERNLDTYSFDNYIPNKGTREDLYASLDAYINSSAK